MMRIKKLLGAMFCFVKHFSKKAYSRGLVIASAGIVTVLLMGTNGYIVNSKEVPMDVGEENHGEETVPDLEQTMEVSAAIEIIEESQTQLPEGAAQEKESELMREEEIHVELLTADAQTQNYEEAVLYTEEEYTAIANIVQAEAGGEDLIGKIMVANVVLNRVKSSRFPDSIYEVVYQTTNGKAQFVPVGNGSIGSRTVSESTYEAVDRALQGEDYSNGALYFITKSYSRNNPDNWFSRTLTKVAEHGAQEFYK